MPQIHCKNNKNIFKKFNISSKYEKDLGSVKPKNSNLIKNHHFERDLFENFFQDTLQINDVQSISKVFSQVRHIQNKIKLSISKNC